MQLKEAKAIARQHGVVIRPHGRGYQVHLKGEARDKRNIQQVASLIAAVRAAEFLDKAARRIESYA